MPTVPEYQGYRVAPTVGARPIAGAPSPEEVGGRQLQQLGAGMSEAGAATRDIALDMQNVVDQVKVNDAINRARGAINDLTYDPQVGYQAQRGNAALTRESGQALPEEYGAKLQSAMANISSQSLQTDQQRRLFQQHADQLAEQFHGSVQSHMLKEFTSYRVSTNDGTIDLAADDAKRNWNDPAKVTTSLEAAKAATYDKGKALGWAPAQVDAAILKTTSGVHASAVMAALENNNPNYALGYLDRFKSQMSGDDILRVQGHVNQQVWAGMALSAVQGATTAVQPQIAPTPFDRMDHITRADPLPADLLQRMLPVTLKTESGGRRFGADGKILTSSAGAKGEMQVLDGTTASPGFGVRPAQNDSPEERARVGRDYLQAMLQRYGDPAKAWAAYNAGPGRLDAALKEAKSDAENGAYRTPPPADAWLQKMPKETQAYVAKNVAALGSPAGGVPDRPTEGDFVGAALARLPPGAAPQAIQMTRTQATQQFSIITKTLDEQGNNAVAQAQRWLASNGGQVNAMPVGLRDAVLRYAPAKLDDLDKYAKAFDGSNVTTNLVLYNRLAAHPQDMAAMPDAAFEMLRTQLSPGDFKHLAGERGTLITGKPGQSPGELNTTAMTTTINDRLRTLKIDPTPKDDGSGDAAVVGQIRKTVRDQLYQAQAQAGKKFNDAETEKFIDTLFATNAELRTSFLGITTGAKVAPILSMKPNEVPKDIRTRLEADFVRAGVEKPTDAQVIGAYQALMFAQRRRGVH